MFDLDVRVSSTTTSVGPDGADASCSMGRCGDATHDWPTGAAPPASRKSGGGVAGGIWRPEQGTGPVMRRSGAQVAVHLEGDRPAGSAAEVEAWSLHRIEATGFGRV